MNFKEIIELIDKVADRGIASLEIEQAGMKLRIEGKGAPAAVSHAVAPAVAAVPTTAPAAGAAAATQFA